MLIVSDEVSPENGDIRLVNGSNSSEGVLEIFSEDTSEWGTVCSPLFNNFSADTVCSQLGYAKANYHKSIVNQ